MNSTHEHTHSHSTSDSEHMSGEEILALLAYMIDHNKHHEEELHSLSHDMNDEAGSLVHKALEHFNIGNRLLEDALNILKNQQH